MFDSISQEATLRAYEQRWLFDIPAEHRFYLASAMQGMPDLAPCSLQAIVWSRGPAHSSDVPQALETIAHALQPGGRLLLHDYIVPGSRLRGKKARREREAGQYINSLCRLKDPAHRFYFAIDRWQDMFAAAGLEMVHATAVPQTLDFSSWLGSAPRRTGDITRLQAMLLQAPERAEAFLTPQRSAAKITFQFTDCFFLTQLAQSTT